MLWTQVEESYIGAEEFCRLAKQDEQTVLRNELTVLKGLNFDLITYAPYRSIDGFLAVHGPLLPIPLEQSG